MPNLIDLKNLSVLYADDDELLRKSTSNTLESLFKKVYTAKDGTEAISIYENIKDIHIVMLDIKMGNVSGIDVAKFIRENNKDIPIFLVSSYTETKDMLEAIRLRVVDYIQKPFTFKELINTLLNCLDNLHKNNALIQNLSDGLDYCPYKKELILDKIAIPLSNNEILILEYLIQHKGQMIRYEILTNVLGDNATEKALKNMISRLHKKTGKNVIKNIAKLGYMLS
jgi:DNA-binding response OmpR family regulator